MAEYDFGSTLKRHGLKPLRNSIETLWVNMTRLCNQRCRHCHIGASPLRTEQMDRQTVERCLEILASQSSCQKLDITGGAPELNPFFEYFVIEARKLNKRVAVRHNLTVTFDGNPQTGDNKQHLPQFFAQNRVEVLASLPHYSPPITEQVRGEGVFYKSIRSLRLLNAQGYGHNDSGLILNLVYNHSGPFTELSRNEMETKYKKALLAEYGIVFNNLLAVTNMPINRFRLFLEERGIFNAYMKQLVDAFTPESVENLVCRQLISVSYDGRLYDCDFNQMRDMPLAGKPLTVFDFKPDKLPPGDIQFGPHCFGCTAGGGSS